MSLIRNLAVVGLGAIVLSAGALFMGTGEADAMNRGQANMICRDWHSIYKVYFIGGDDIGVPFHSYIDCVNWVSRGNEIATAI